MREPIVDPLPRHISPLSVHKCGNTAPKPSKIGILSTNLPFWETHLNNFYDSQYLCASIGSLHVFSLVAFGDRMPSYKHFSSMAAFSHKFSIAPWRRNYWWDPKKLRGAKTSSITTPSLMEIVRRMPAGSCRQKSVSVCFLSRFQISKFVKSKTLLSSVILKTIMVSLHRGRFLIVHLYIEVFLWALRIFP